MNFQSNAWWIRRTKNTVVVYVTVRQVGEISIGKEQLEQKVAQELAILYKSMDAMTGNLLFYYNASILHILLCLVVEGRASKHRLSIESNILSHTNKLDS